MKCLIGRKLEMTQRFREDGTIVPVTLIRASACQVTQVKTTETDGYEAVQLGTEQKKTLSKPQTGHLQGLEPMGVLREFRLSAGDLKRGDNLTLETFQPGDHIDVVGTSKGHGFAGVVKRHHFGGSPKSHGHKDQLRMPGSISSRRQGPVAKGKRMAGQMGNERVTVKNLEIISVDPRSQVIAVKGAIPGARGGLVLLVGHERKTVWQK